MPIMFRADGAWNSPGGNLPASLAVYVLVLHIIPYVPDIGLLFRRHRCMVGIHSGHPAFGLSLFFICMLMTRFCYLTLDNENLTVHSAGRTIRYPYTDLRKVNFDFAREQTFTHIMELLDKDYRYRLFYIGRVSRKKLNEIAERLQQAGVDATCSLNDNKRFYHDNRH